MPPGMAGKVSRVGLPIQDPASPFCGSMFPVGSLSLSHPIQSVAGSLRLLRFLYILCTTHTFHLSIIHTLIISSDSCN